MGPSLECCDLILLMYHLNPQPEKVGARMEVKVKVQLAHEAGWNAVAKIDEEEG
jgi:hypothetical protein